MKRTRAGTRVTALLVASLTAVTVVTAATAVNAPAAAAAQGVGAIPAPDEDPFYAQPPDLADTRPGDLLDSRKVDVNAYLIPLPVDAWQVKYRSEDNTGKPTADVTTIMVPKTAWTGPGPRPLVSYQTAEDSAGTQCAPSYGLRVGPIQSPIGNFESGPMTLALQRGWAVAAPDYEGPDSQLLGGYAEAHGVLDSLTAIRRFEPADLQHSPIGLTGYSGGAVATTWATQYQRRLAPDLPIRGVAMGGVVADYRSTIKQFDLFQLDAVVMMGVATISRAYPGQKLVDTYLNDKGKQVYDDVARSCAHEAMLRHPLARIERMTTVPKVFDDPRVVSFLRRISPISNTGTPMAPIFEYHAISDELAPIGPARELVRHFCAAGAKVEMTETPGEHGTEAVRGLLPALNYLSDRFAGQPAPSDCRS